ncbi:MAG: aconitate hydratase AcnA [Proteobacteria bacterium]|jgi:aconitate hydratase|nr:aconitate hydratase AcnA [Pseudomonadota bacterium]
MTQDFHNNCRDTLNVSGKEYEYFSLKKLASTFPAISKLPFSTKVLLENLLRYQDGSTVNEADIKAVANWSEGECVDKEINYRPARILLQDFTGVPCVVDLAAMRDAMVNLGGDPDKINPLSPVDLVIDHSVMVDHFGGPESFKKNVDLEMSRNQERYTFLRWGSKAFDNFRVVPPGTGICHQVNVEYLAQTVWTKTENGKTIAYPDTCVGTDSHTTMVNSLAVLGWGVGGIEAEAAMLGQPISMLVPEVIGFKLTGKLPEGATATDLVLTITQMLRARGVVGKFVEFFGPGLDQLALSDRSTISNMAPEYGATCGFFPIDRETINYLKLTAREDDRIALVEEYAKAQGMWRDESMEDPVFTDTMSLDLNTIVSSLAGPKRPQDRVPLDIAKESFEKFLKENKRNKPNSIQVEGSDIELKDGDVVIAAITSCTNTSNPSVLIAAGLLARAAHQKGMKVKPWVKTSLAPGSQVVSDYLEAAGLQKDLDSMGFNLVGYGCTTCIGNSGPLTPALTDAVNNGDLIVTSVLSGNRNFEGRVSPDVRANFLASPPLVVAYALAGSLLVDVTKESLGDDRDGNPVYLKDIWPSNEEIRSVVNEAVTPEMYRNRYANVFDGTKEWQAIETGDGQTYDWDDSSTYVQNPPYFEGMTMEPDEAEGNIIDAKAIALLGDSITTDHISPAGSISRQSPAADYLMERQVRPEEFNSYGARRGNHQIMMRGTFANIRLANEMVPGTIGGFSRIANKDKIEPIYNIAMEYQENSIPLIVFGGKEYGTGSSRDWAAKGTYLLGIKAVIAESFERIHRSNLIGMGVLPLQLPEGITRKSLGLLGDESFDLMNLDNGVSSGMTVKLVVKKADGVEQNVDLLCRIDTDGEAEYFRHGGILQYVLRQLAA